MPIASARGRDHQNRERGGRNDLESCGDPMVSHDTNDTKRGPLTLLLLGCDWTRRSGTVAAGAFRTPQAIVPNPAECHASKKPASAAPKQEAVGPQTNSPP